jgi:hypothetical protein
VTSVQPQQPPPSIDQSPKRLGPARVFLDQRFEDTDLFRDHAGVPPGIVPSVLVGRKGFSGQRHSSQIGGGSVGHGGERGGLREARQ